MGENVGLVVRQRFGGSDRRLAQGYRQVADWIRVEEDWFEVVGGWSTEFIF